MTRRTTILTSAFFAVLAVLMSGRHAEAASTCPGAYTVESSNGHDYVAVFYAPNSQRASFNVTVYGKQRAYGFALDDVALDRPLSGLVPFRSLPVMFENPDGGPLLGYSIDVKPEAGSCAAIRGQIPDVDSVVHPRAPREAEEAATLREIASETAALTTVVNPVPKVDVVVPQCAQPFSDAHLLQTARLKYPDIAGNPTASGTTIVKVTLSDLGSVTDATVFKSSGYHELDAAAVEAYGGNFIFVADFGLTAR